ncbi:methionyl-tRNA formyltransferase [Roseospira navarrensis]|uniref:Methionyl-tRNA formyltransferase n=1 Tax=Roseospira navarrensis TaxID=140058 RepID=A0A7X2D4Z6_9PROT|nr:methionyl-tRNA formyltransferase [Roseospira navarrensis]MQX38453.1 methionyl-tRNA formyltransferase [Roseospira navarrensis]
MSVVFMGTPDFAVPALEALAESHDVVCVYCQPPRPAGRGKKPRPSPVQRAAEARGLPVRHPATLKDPADRQAFADLKADVAVVAAYGLILPRPVLEAPRLGCVNIHASLLPRWRGAAPIHRAVMAGDPNSGLTIMRMEAGLDTGPMLLKRAVPLGPETTTGDLHDTLAALGGPLVLEALAGLEAGTLTETPQPDDGVTYAAKIDKAEGRLDWTRPAADLDRLVRGLCPAPGAFFDLEDDRLKVLKAAPVPGRADAAPGTVLDDRLTVACGEGSALRLERVQRPGKGPVEADAFLRGRPVPAGTRLPGA